MTARRESKRERGECYHCLSPSRPGRLFCATHASMAYRARRRLEKTNA